MYLKITRKFSDKSHPVTLGKIDEYMCPKLHTIFKGRLHQCRADRDKPLPQLAGDAFPGAPKTQLSLLAASALLTHIQLAINHGELFS
ncbi:hypothetical protein BTVI_65308 [Pitangus sulphuratus]|nr:hypothetical protein BTVI_65308 [Pitangus sulphuratus]